MECESFNEKHGTQMTITQDATTRTKIASFWQNTRTIRARGHRSIGATSLSASLHLVQLASTSRIIEVFASTNRPQEFFGLCHLDCKDFIKLTGVPSESSTDKKKSFFEYDLRGTNDRKTAANIRVSRRFLDALNIVTEEFRVAN